MKSERLVSLMLLLQAKSPRSARDLARTLEVSMRTVYRDVDALSTTGVPVYAERGPNGGITLSDGYRQAIAQFSTDELHALFVAAADPLADLGIAAHERALHKIKGALPDLQRRAAEKAGQRILLDHNRWYRSEQPAHILASLRRAVWDDRALLLTYRDRNGALTTREIDPLGLISKAGVWYVAARIPNGELRTFRAERIEHVEELRRQFARPADFDLHVFWLNATSKPEHEGCAYEATLRLEGDATEWIMPYFPAEAIEQDASGKTYRVRFPSQEAAVGHVMMLGKRAQVVGPDDFRSAVVARARELLAILSG